MSDDIRKVMSTAFAFNDIYIYSHGWWTDESRAMTDYNRFATGYATNSRVCVAAARAAGAAAADWPQFPQSALATAIHWPSALSETNAFVMDVLGAATFYSMEKRADDVGETGVYGLLRLILESRPEPLTPLRFNLIGHSFGTKVICAALSELLKECGGEPYIQQLSVRAVLLQAAFSQYELDIGGDYGALADWPALKVLVTHSDEDKALGTLFPFASKVRFHFAQNERTALGFGGPTATTVARLGGSEAVVVNPGDDFTRRVPFTGRLVVADLTTLHRQHNATNAYAPSAMSGNHSDIFCDEINGVIARFLY